MHKVTAEKMDAILREMSGDESTVSAHEILDIQSSYQAAVNPFDFNAYDHYANGGELEFDTVIYRHGIDSAIEEAGKYPDEWTCISEARAEEIYAGSKLTNEEIEAVKQEYIQREVEDESAEYMTISEVTDGNRTVFALYQEQMQGQGGNQITDFHGFFETEEDARAAMDNLEGIVIA